MLVFHSTPPQNFDSIIEEGLKARSSKESRFWSRQFRYGPCVHFFKEPRQFFEGDVVFVVQVKSHLLEPDPNHPEAFRVYHDVPSRDILNFHTEEELYV